MNKPPQKMSIADRAKQFAPFAALRGLDAALHAREKIIVDKIELSEELLSELDYKMHLIKKGDRATIVYFEKGEYIKISGIVSRIDETSRIIQIVTKKISFDDIYSVS